ncbi:hypothetical protein ERJ75_001586000 [Trypanosoma vivax]|nr:hypothetical protein ERJ75_001586000 [Trypanosoma vivax]
MALSAGPAGVEDAMLRRIWDLILRIVQLRVSVNFQFVFSHCGVPRNEAADKAAEQGNVKPQSRPARATDIVAGVERKVRSEMHRAFEEGRMPRRHRSALLDHVRLAGKLTKLDRLCESLLALFRTGTSKHFGWLRRVSARKTDQLECRWCTKKCVGYAWLRKHMLQKHAEKQLSSGPNEAQDAPDSDGEAAQEGQEQSEFVCQQRHRVLKSKTWLTSRKREATSSINSEGSNVAEQLVTVACPICSKGCRYRRLLRHMLTKRPRHDEPSRP